ncbi:MAG: fluoride efflux transporter CrcB [Actinobacteria bacterium]|nr:fluoride efflux transporter CrcB [Actinomycetota bacterium]
MGVDRRTLLAIFCGGAIGALVRYGLVELLPSESGRWPWSTFLANVVGCFLLGYFATRLQERLPLSAYRRPLLGTGLCGALTTFSTFQLELTTMLREGDSWLAAGYAGASVIAGGFALIGATAFVRGARLL